MSRWLKNVNALLENLDNQVEERVEEHTFNRTLSEAVKKGGGGGTDENAISAAVEGLLQEEAQGVDDILAKRGLLGDSGKDVEEYEADDDDAEVINSVDNTESNNVLGVNEGGDSSGQGNETIAVGDNNTDNKTPEVAPKDDTSNTCSQEKGSIAKLDTVGVSKSNVSEEITFGEDSSSSNANNNNDGENEKKKDLFADADVVTIPPVEGKYIPKEQPKEEVSAVVKPTITAKAAAMTKPTISAPPKSNTTDAASLKELRKLRRHVLQLNSDLESAERELEAQRQELDRAASRMERDRSRHKQEKESLNATHKAEITALTSSHELMIQQLKEANEKAMEGMEARVTRAEQERAKEGGERDAELSDALERENASVASVARLQEEKTTMNERITSFTTEVSRLETRLENATSQMDLASERERNAEEQLDKALSVHARQLGVRQHREVELEQTVAELGAALVVAKNKVEAAMKAGIDLGGDMLSQRSSSTSTKEDEDVTVRLQDAQDEIETLQAQLNLEQQRCSTLHSELQDLSKEHVDELSGAHAKQRQYERKISDLTTQLQSSRMLGDDGLFTSDSEVVRGSSGFQSSGDEKKETDHLRKQITSLSEKIFEQQSKIDHARSEISTLKNRLSSMKLRAETAEKSFETANQRLMMIDVPTSGVSSADEEMGLSGQRVVGKRPRRGFHKTSKIESIRSTLGLQPGRFPSGGWQEIVASLLDTFDSLAIDLGSHFRHYPISRLAFMIYLLILHLWAFFLLVYHAHAQGTGNEVHGPEAMFSSYRQPKLVAAAASNNMMSTP